MNNDGFGQVGAGQDDRRLAGKDLQHNVQTRTVDEAPGPHRIVHQEAGQGGPMKEHMDKERKDMAQHLMHQEANRHEHAMKHHKHHLEHHHMRGHDAQHGHDNYKYGA